MWRCPLCNRQFVKVHQVHSCLDKSVEDFLAGRSVHTTALFYQFVDQYRLLGNVQVHATKSMIVISGRTTLAYITRLGRECMDIVFPFKEPHTENLCFTGIKRVPGSNQYNHHFRMCLEEDLNEELKFFMNLSLAKDAK
jgi:hypothetical protein